MFRLINSHLQAHSLQVVIFSITICILALRDAFIQKIVCQHDWIYYYRK